MEGFEISEEQEQAGLLAAIENTDICMFWYYPKEQLITMGERTAQMYSCRRVYTDMPKSFADDFVHPSTQSDFYEMYRRIDAGEKTAHASFSSIDRRNWCTVTLTTVEYDAQGRPERTYGIVQNISEMKMQQAEYHSSHRMLSGIIGALSKIYIFNYYIDLRRGVFKEITGIDYITAVLGETGDARRAFEQFSATLITESYREEFASFVDLDTLAERIGERQNISLEYLSLKQGWCRAGFIVVSRDEDGRAAEVEFVVENINAKRQRELEARETLEKAYEAANRANASKSMFLNSMSHDIRTPMNAIAGFAMIASSHLDDRERVEDCISKITASSNHLLAIINEVLDMSRIESGKMRLQLQNVYLPEMMSQFIDMVQGQAGMKGLEICCDITGIVHKTVYADEGKIHRVLLNLVGNAIKFTPRGGRIQIRMTETETACGECRNYLLSVKDTGIGMSAEFLPKVFEAFERERTSTVSKVEGTGLGMSITRSLVEMMGGHISADSEPGKGTEFLIELPFQPVMGEIEEHREESYDLNEIAKGKRILLVEDNELNREIAIEILTVAGFAVDTAEDGQTAVDKVADAEEGTYDIVLMDIQMPVMDGYTAARTIRELPSEWTRRLPILAMTANAFEEDRRDALAAGMNGHLTKPIELDKLFRALAEALDGRGTKQ